jgi:hypothetical protein
MAFLQATFLSDEDTPLSSHHENTTTVRDRAETKIAYSSKIIEGSEWTSSDKAVPHWWMTSSLLKVRDSTWKQIKKNMGLGSKVD